MEGLQMGKINECPGVTVPINLMHIYLSVTQSLFIDNGTFRKLLDIIGEISLRFNLHNILQILALTVL